MNDAQFIAKIYAYAEALKKSPLTQTEEDEILAHFNSEKGTAQERAIRAVRRALGLDVLKEEFRKSANLDNTARLLQDLQKAATQWQANKN